MLISSWALLRLDEVDRGGVRGHTGDEPVGAAGDHRTHRVDALDLGARHYDAATGRFTQADTVIGDLTSPVTLNRYTYGNADPLNHFDPDWRRGGMENWGGGR